MGENPSTSVCCYACPQCKGNLRNFAKEYKCVDCGRSFPVHEDIPDLRIGLNEAESAFYAEVSFNHHYAFSQRDHCYFRDQDHFADQVGFLLRLRELRTFLARIYADEEKEMTILDAGCGDGIMTQFLLRQSNHIYCVDLSLNSLKRACKFLSSPNMHTPKSLDLAQCNIHAFPFFDSFFDVVILTEALEHTSNPELVLSEVHRTLKVGGKFYITTPNIDGTGLLYRRLKRLTRKIGFRLKEKREIYRKIEEAENRYGIRAHVGEFSIDELKTLLLKVGFSNLRLYTRYSSYLDLQMVSKSFRGLDRFFCSSWSTRMYAAIDQSISSWQVLQSRGFIQICSGERLR